MNQFMQEKYQNWIENYNEKRKIITGLCFPACALMFKYFPELTICRGYVIDGWGKKHTHWFLKTDTNEIIDPTISQFDYLLVAGNLEYKEYNFEEDGPLATGKCYDCGNLLYNNEKFCNDKCEKSTLEYLNVSNNI